MTASPRTVARLNIGTVIGIVSLAIIVLAALLVPMLSPERARTISDVLATRLVPPGGRDARGALHLLGTDALGRDIFVRVWVAARITLAVGVAGSLLAGALGILLGAFAGWQRGRVEQLIVAIGDAMLSVPRLILLLVIAALWGPGLSVVVIVLGLTGWMSVMRLVRADVQGVRALPFVECARALGIPPMRLLGRHVLPNALGSAVVAITLGIGNAITLESGLSFLGLGIQPPAPSWGNMIAAGREWLLVAPWIALIPGVALVTTVVACTLLGDAFSRRLARGGASARHTGQS